MRNFIEEFQFGAHASLAKIVRYVKQLAPKKIVLVHGDRLRWNGFARKNRKGFAASTEVIVPTPGVEIELAALYERRNNFSGRKVGRS